MYNNHNDWHNWGETGYDAMTDPSAASTPCGSPHHSIGQKNGLYLPMDAMRMPPPFPGTGGSDTPYSMGSGYSMGSPCMSPAGMDTNPGQNGMMSPGQMQYNGGMMAAPAMPPFPFPGGAVQGYAQGATPGMDASAQFYQVPVTSSAQGNMMMQTSSAGAVPTSFAPGGPNLTWQGQPSDSQQSPFPMPLSSPHDLAQQCAPTHPQQGAYFEFMPEGGQTPGQGQAGSAGPSPFCL